MITPDTPVDDRVLLATVYHQVVAARDADTGPIPDTSPTPDPYRERRDQEWDDAIDAVADAINAADLWSVGDQHPIVHGLIDKAVAAHDLTHAHRAVHVRELACGRLDTDVARLDTKATATASATALIGGGAVTVAAATGGLAHLPVPAAIAAGVAGVGVLATLGACAATWWPARRRDPFRPFAGRISIEEYLDLLDAHHELMRGLFDSKTRRLRAAIGAVGATAVAAVAAVSIALIGGAA